MMPLALIMCTTGVFIITKDISFVTKYNLFSPIRSSFLS